jgi:hypothetical protein
MKRFAVLAMIVAAPGAADPIRLRADALATTHAPAGLLMLEAEGTAAERVSAEAVVWMAAEHARGDGATGDVLVIALRGRTKSHRANGQLGRFVSTLGALRPVHVDGVGGRLRLPAAIDIEAVAGMPVVPGLASARSWDWFAGGRVARRIGEAGSIGVAYGQRRDAGLLVTEEVGFDAGLALGKRHDVGARVAYDVANPGIAEIALTSSHRRKSLRAELYAVHREASHLLPATSLFSVIGDVPSQRAGGVLTWRAAPRLDLIADAGARRIEPDYGLELVGRARLRLDDRGTSALGAELRRSGVGEDMWTGARGTARLALPRSFTASAELELVIPDVDRGRGTVWPWALAALAWQRGDWQAAVAVEASASAEYRHRIDALAQLSRRWSLK